MKKILKITILVIVAILLIVMCGCKKGGDSETPDTPSIPSEPSVPTNTPVQPTIPVTPTDSSPSPEDSPSPVDTPEPEPEPLVYINGEVVISFDFVKQSGSASNQYAVWVEDMEGNYIKTLYASRWTATGGYKTRPESLSLWSSRALLALMPKEEVDAVSGATPKTGKQSYTWDLTNTNGEPVPAGEYMFLVEGTMRWKNFLIFSGVINISDEPMTVVADKGFIYEASDNYGELTEDSIENDMIGEVKAVFTPSAVD